MSYYHHGIFVGGNVGVIHYGGESKKNATIKVDDLRLFWGNKRLVRITYPQREPRDPNDVIETAVRLKDNPADWGEYHLLKKNCEHFATYCKIGIAVSTQVDKKIKSIFKKAKRTVCASSASSASGMSSAVALLKQ